MALRFTNLTPTYQWPVEFHTPGLPKPQKFNATFRRLTKERINEIVQSVQDAAGGDDEAIDDIELMFEVMEGWDATDDDNKGEPIPFDRKTLTAICNALPRLPGAVVEAFVNSVYKAKAKNSKAS
jgi:hypothetical protein